MKKLNGWFATIGLSGALVVAAVLAIGGGTAALHQSTLLSRSQPISVTQPAAGVSPSPQGADPDQFDDWGGK